MSLSFIIIFHLLILGMLHYLKYGLATILIFVGLKILTVDVLNISIELSLLFILLVMGCSIFLSMKSTRSKEKKTAFSENKS
jgi:tellurite resistance protein TerC